MRISEQSSEPISNGLTSSPEDSPVKTSAKPENGPELKALGRAFGLSLRASLGSFDLDTCSLKTSQACLFTMQCDEFSESFPDSGMMLSGSVYELQTSELRISESASSSWPTPDTGESKTGHGARGGICKNGHQSGMDLKATSAQWSTPSAHDGRRPGSHATSTQGANLKRDAEVWQTPHGMSNVDFRGKVGGCGAGEFAKQANQWPTPNAHDATGARGPGFELTGNHYSPHDLVAATDQWQTPATDSFRSRGGERVDEMGLDQQARIFPSSLPDPQTADGPKSSESVQIWCRLWPTATEQDAAGARNETATRPQSSSHHSGTTLTDAVLKSEVKDGKISTSLRLNPRFVEWLMGFPTGWSEL